MPVTVSTRVDDELARMIEEVAEREGMDRSTVMRRFLSDGVRDWMISRSLEEYQGGRLTLWQAAARCGLSLWEMIQEVERRDVRVPYTVEALREDLKGL